MIPNTEPTKWRDGIDPFSLPLETLQIQEILGYPHAGNQVFHVRALNQGTEGYYYLKYAHRPDANFRNEAEILRLLDFPCVPRVVEYDRRNSQYVVTEQIQGQRLSVLLANAETENAMDYMYAYGQTLARLHQVRGPFSDAPYRVFHDIPDQARLAERGIAAVHCWLEKHKPHTINRCFVHGDFHYANILWRDGHISGILDFELAGMGNREFDIVWALILRPGQRFLKTEGERERFLAGYTSLESCDSVLVRYYMVLIYTRFLKAGDAQYEQYVREWLQNATSAYGGPGGLQQQA